MLSLFNDAVRNDVTQRSRRRLIVPFKDDETADKISSELNHQPSPLLIKFVFSLNMSNVINKIKEKMSSGEKEQEFTIQPHPAVRCLIQ